MFGIFASEQSRARHDARNWLHLADKVFHFRRDQLPQPEIQALQQAQHELKTRVQQKADAARLKMGIERLEGCLRRSGGAYYPKSSTVENIEFFLVAMILFLGIRAFFFQPFKIPTNSMWPSYYGMTPEIFLKPEQEPGTVAKAFRFLTLGASPRRIDAPVDGSVQLAVERSSGYFQAYAESVPIRKWLIFPAVGRRLTFFVNGETVRLTIPDEFINTMTHVLESAFFQGTAGGVHYAAQEQERRTRAQLPDRILALHDGKATRVQLLDVNLRVRTGDRILSFDILTGDQLFVDRITYNFVPPEVGDAFVFRTRKIPQIGGDQYYIKRLVGVPGDTLSVEPPKLIRNGEPIQGSAAFEMNAQKQAPFRGYSNYSDLAPGRSAVVPEDSFYAMGDNSYESSDSRKWGFVPAREVVGRPLFIYFPFTRRWGHSP